MKFMNCEQGETITIRVDNVVTTSSGILLVEAMFSCIVDLSASYSNLVARLHPAKARVFEWIVTRQQLRVEPTIEDKSAASVFPSDETLHDITDVQFHVNKPDGGHAIRSYSEFRDLSRRLLTHGSDEHVRRTKQILGFDPDGEPILREMNDGSLLLIFGFIPPLVTEQDPFKAKRFDSNKFGEELQRAVGLPVTWDDREVFVVPKPQIDTTNRIQSFLANYWRDSKSQWWKFW